MKLVLFLFALSLQAQSFNVGGPAVDGYAADSGCGGTVWSPANDPAMATMTGIYQTLRYAPSFSCSFSVPNGFYLVSLALLEPNKTAVGARRFSVSVNGLVTQTLDLFALTGLRKPWPLTVPALVTNGTIKLQLSATIGNAVLSGVSIQSIPLTGLKGDPGPPGPPGPAGTAIFKQCSGPTSPVSDCTGLLYVSAKMNDGSTMNMLGVRAPADFTPSQDFAPFASINGTMLAFVAGRAATVNSLIMPLLTTPIDPANIR